MQTIVLYVCSNGDIHSNDLDLFELNEKMLFVVRMRHDRRTFDEPSPEFIEEYLDSSYYDGEIRLIKDICDMCLEVSEDIDELVGSADLD